MNYLLVFVGGGLGATLRHLINLFCARCIGTGFPWGTFIINISGSTVMGLIAGYLAMTLLWPAVTLCTNLVTTEVVPCRMVAVAVATTNTLAQLGAFVVPVLWGINKDSTGSYHFGLTLIPLLFIASAGIAMHLRHQIRREVAITPAIAAA